MAIEFACPNCGGTLQVGDENAGRVIRCGGCMTALRVPIPDTSPRPAPSAPASPFETDAAPPPPRRRSRSEESDPQREDNLPTAHRVDSPRPRRRRRAEPAPPPPSSGRILIWFLVIGGMGVFS